MKTVFVSLTAAVSIVTAAAPAGAAPFSLSAQAQLDVKQLASDVKGIAAHADIDPSDVQKLEDDLALLVSGVIKPSLDSVRKLGTDAAAAFADGRLTSAEEFALLNDLKAVLSSAGLSDAQIQTVQADILNIVTSSSITSADLALILTDVEALLADLQGTFVVTTQTIQLSPPTNAGTSAKASSATTDTAVIINALRAAIGAQASVGISTSSLEAGSYNVSVTAASSGAQKPLGSLVVTGEAGKHGTGAASFGAGGQPLPGDFDVADVAAINITNAATGQPVLSGKTSEAKDVRSANLTLAGGAAAPSAKGDVSFQTRQKPSGPKSSFVLSASKLPHKTRVTLKINGADAGQAKTDARGKLLIARGNVSVPTKGDGLTPKVKVTPLSSAVDVSSIRSVELDTLDGQIVATAGFAE